MKSAHFKLFLFAFMMTVFACTNNRDKNDSASITLIEVATGYCHGDCSFTAIQIDKLSNYKYYGGTNAPTAGARVPRVLNLYYST
ncbi:hypothetical protein MUGA111182_19930 [Mucilaginibacter galii]|uniref:Omp28-related outer membrane protein n=1 Tax=Mucilaginibacter galii TaxID=2005073 RepID=A0A917N4Q7_9SPHI|nr:hypothetical protein [Mucilaginibacter galii]GGI52387.1 hypothetical protein GCM10011425_35990 [Mucilaginibacter galii]